MQDRFLIVVEGIADETFIRQYIYHLFGQKVPDNFILRTFVSDLHFEIFSGFQNVKTKA